MDSHYNDGLIDVQNVDEFSLVVFVNRNGDTKAVIYDDNFFSPHDLIEAYRGLWRQDWNMGEEQEKYVANYKNHLKALGCNEEDLEEQQ